MATNFFQRWSSRKLKAREETAPETPDTAIVNEDATTDAAVSNVVHDAAVTEATAENAVTTTKDKTAPESLSPATSTTTSTTAVSTAEGVESDNNGTEKDENAEVALPTLNDVVNVSFESGVTDFMKAGVEKSVKKAALRKLFHSDEFNYISDMDDHTEDFSNVPALDATVTAQLRSWVNQAAEHLEDALEQTVSGADTQASPSAALVDEIDSDVALPDSFEQYHADEPKDVNANAGADDAEALADKAPAADAEDKQDATHRQLSEREEHAEQYTENSNDNEHVSSAKMDSTS
ncbi:DUF3306 domain-containing protein [Photobacterium aphoticum]|uniref:DUF3306 domain-containing protein n=1 Tax=Photobacterium aphoticum TaxID=754436 RepID=UPI00069D941B|nr:DUF3306 domain-containing protein [Photobacterium aphoticum]PSU59888.1 DUF3306 domain-containing protein [Photobacterium aphoticum]GHA41539.1 hypothetical protein GCM10007086_13790 [Photobacterium aphoticum]